MISTNDITLAVPHNISLITSYSALPYTDTTSTIVTFIVPCNLTTWVANSIPNLATSINLPLV